MRGGFNLHRLECLGILHDTVVGKLRNLGATSQLHDVREVCESLLVWNLDCGVWKVRGEAQSGRVLRDWKRAELAGSNEGQRNAAF